MVIASPPTVSVVNRHQARLTIGKDMHCSRSCCAHHARSRNEVKCIARCARRWVVTNVSVVRMRTLKQVGSLSDCKRKTKGRWRCPRRESGCLPVGSKCGGPCCSWVRQNGDSSHHKSEYKRKNKPPVPHNRHLPPNPVFLPASTKEACHHLAPRAIAIA